MWNKLVVTEIGNCIPPEWFGQGTQNQVCPNLLDYQAALGDYSAGVFVHAECRLNTAHIVMAPKLCTKILQILTGLDPELRQAICIPKCIKYPLLE